MRHSDIEVDEVDTTLERVTEEGTIVVDGPFEEREVSKTAIVQVPVGAYLRHSHFVPHHHGEVFDIPGAMIVQ